MALYAADIEVRLKNKGELTRLEKQFKKLADVSIQLDKTLKSLGKSNVIKVETRGALSAINQLETKIKGLSRTVSVNASTSGGGRRSEGGLSGAAMPMMAAAMGGGRSSSRTEAASFNAKKDLLGISNTATEKHLKYLMGKEAEYVSFVESSNQSVTRSRSEQANALKDLNKHEEIRVPLYEKLNKALSEQADLNQKNIKGAGKFGDQIKNLSTLATALTATTNDGGFVSRKKHLLDMVKLKNDELKVSKKINKSHIEDLDLVRKRMEAAQNPEKLMSALTMSERDIDLNKKLDIAMGSALDKADKLVTAQSQFVKETAKGGPATKATVDGLKQAEEAARRAATQVADIHKKLAQPPSMGLIGGMKSLGMGGAKEAFGKGALGASAMIPGLTPFTIGAAAGGVGKTGGAALAGGALGVAGAGVVMGGLALGNFIKQATIASSEMKKMELALSAVVTSNEDYKKALDSVEEISNSLLIPQAQVTKSFTRLQAAASASGFEVNDVNNMMKGFSAALVATEGDTKNFNGVMLALGQVMGKGKAAAEEIRGQIGERLSIVIPELAESMGKTTRELDKMFDDGKVTVQNIVDLGVHLEEKYGKSAANILKSQMNAGERLKYELSRLSLAVGPLFENIGAGFQNLGSKIVQGLTPAIEALSELLDLTETAQRDKLEKMIIRDAQKDKDFGIDDIFKKTSISEKNVRGAVALRGPSKAKDYLTELFGRDATKNLRRSDFSKIAKDEQRNSNIDALRESIEKVFSGTKNKKTGGGEDDAKLQASWEKALQRLKDQKEFQDKLNEGGTAYAERWRKINEIASQFPTKPREEIEELVTGVENAEKAGKSAKAVYEDWLDGIETRLTELNNPMYQLTTLVDAASDSFQNSFKEMVKGTKSVGDAFVDMFSRIADAYLDMVAETIAAKASKGLGSFFMNLGLNALGSALGGGSTTTNSFQYSNAPSMNYGYENLSSSVKFASGGYVDRPTNAVIGEGSEGEYVIPESKLASSLSRFQAGHRGNSVVPGGVGNSGGSGGGSGEVTVNYTGPTLNFNGDEYVPRSAVPQIINSAAMAGASAGRANTMKDLKNSRSQRARLGL